MTLSPITQILKTAALALFISVPALCSANCPEPTKAQSGATLYQFATGIAVMQKDLGTVTQIGVQIAGEIDTEAARANIRTPGAVAKISAKSLRQKNSSENIVDAYLISGRTAKDTTLYILYRGFNNEEGFSMVVNSKGGTTCNKLMGGEKELMEELTAGLHVEETSELTHTSAEAFASAIGL